MTHWVVFVHKETAELYIGRPCIVVETSGYECFRWVLFKEIYDGECYTTYMLDKMFEDLGYL